jgi:signal transduction histidine kinase
MTKRRDSRAELLLAVAHEVGNLLAAIRLSAHLLPHAAEARERARGAREIEQLAAQAGEFLAQVRPLVAGVRGRGAAISPAEVLASVRRALSDAPGAERLVVRPPPRGLPDVRVVDSEALLHALLTLVRGALEASDAHGPVDLRARRSARGVAFEIADLAPAPPATRPGTAPRGRALAVRLADAALRPAGRVEASPRRGGTRVCVTVPAAPRRPRTSRRPRSRRG